MIKGVFQVLVIFIFGAIGGIVWQAILLPYLAQNSAFQDFWFIKEFKEREVVVLPKEEIYIQENVALTEAVEKVEKSIVGIRVKTKKGKIIEGSGLILSSDGLLVTLADLLPQGSAFSFFVNGEIVPFEILKRDGENNLALVRIKKQNLQTCSFADFEKIKRGQRVFLVGVIFLNGKTERMVNSGIVKYFGKDFIRTNIFEKKILKGSGLFDIEGNVLGINTIDSEGKVTAIPISKIKEFANFQ